MTNASFNFDESAAGQRLDAAMKKSEGVVTEADKARFDAIVREVAKVRPLLSADDVAQRIAGTALSAYKVQVLMGHGMRRAARAGIIRKTSQQVTCQRESRQKGVCTVWESLIFDPAAALEEVHVGHDLQQGELQAFSAQKAERVLKLQLDLMGREAKTQQTAREAAEARVKELELKLLTIQSS